MPASMTGYGKGEAQLKGFYFLVEIKSTNHRYCDFFIRLPKEMQFLEEKVRAVVKEKISRGRMEINIRVDTNKQLPKKVEIDEELAESFYHAIKRLRNKLQLNDSFLRIDQLVSFPEIMKIEEEQVDPNLLWLGLNEALKDALNNLQIERYNEGNRIKEDIIYRLKKISILVGECEKRSPLVVEHYRKRLYKQFQELLEGTIELDENRLIMETMIFAERCNITEEVVRLKSHLVAFLETLDSGEPVGRKLDFILQEMLREINTIGSKGNDYDITKGVVEVKSELEKIREQIQNVE